MSTASRRAFMAQLASSVALTAAGSANSTALSPISGPGKDPTDAAYWRWVRGQFLVDPKIAYMNTGSRGASPASVVTAQFDAIRRYDNDRLSYIRYVGSAAAKERLRTRLAEFVGCRVNEIAMTTNTTEGMSIGTNGLDLAPGDEVIYTNHDHASGAQPINLRAARHGIVPVMVDLSNKNFHPPAEAASIVDAIDAAITPRTKLISFCHVNYTDGCVMPVKEICALARAKGIFTLVDGAHPPGMLKLNLHDLGCDMYAGAGHKWLLASMQTGFFFVREPLLDRVWPMNYTGPVNGMSMYGEAYPNGSTLERSQTAAKYEMHGSGHFASRASLAAALDFHNALTREAIEARVRHMATRVQTSFHQIPGVRVHTSDDPAMTCGLVSFDVNGLSPAKVTDTLWSRHQIYIRHVVHPEIDWAVNRASLHVMVDDDEVNRLIGAVEEIAKDPRV